MKLHSAHRQRGFTLIEVIIAFALLALALTLLLGSMSGAARQIRHADDAGRRSLATFARADRPFTEDEAKFLAARLAWLHGALVPPPQED